LNVPMDGASLTDSGMEFQMTGDEWEKVHWPIVRWARGTHIEHINHLLWQHKTITNSTVKLIALAVLWNP